MSLDQFRKAYSKKFKKDLSNVTDEQLKESLNAIRDTIKNQYKAPDYEENINTDTKNDRNKGKRGQSQAK
jgi:hypothetical protein